MKRIVMLIVIFIMIPLGICGADVTRIACLYSADLDHYYRNNVNQYIQESLDTSFSGQTVLTKTYFLNMKGNFLSEQQKSKIYASIKDFDPEYIINFGDEALIFSYPFLISECSKIKIANVGISKNQYTLNILTDESMFFLVYEIDIQHLFEFFQDNIFYTEHFYILRDDNLHNLNLFLELRQKLLEINNKFKIEQTKINSIQELRKELAQLHKKKKGVIIPLLSTLLDYDRGLELDYHNILRLIRSNNLKHLELVIHDNGSVYGMGLSLASSYYTQDDPNFLKRFFLNEMTDSFTLKTPNKILINKNTLKKTGHNNLLRNLEKVDKVYD